MSEMCDKADIAKMDARMDSFENRLTKVETKQDAMQAQISVGFADLKSYIANTLAVANANSAEWGRFLRMWLSRILIALLSIALIACGANVALKFIS